MIPDTLSKRITTLRLAKKFNQTQLANLVGISQQSLQAIEAGLIEQPRRILKLAEVLETTPEWLYYGAGDPPKYLNTRQLYKDKIPLIYWEWVSKWHRNYDINAIINNETEELKIIFLTIPSEKNSKQFALKIKGDSMTSSWPGKRSFLENQVIIIDPEIPLKEGNYILALNKDNETEPIFARYVFFGGQYFLKPINTQYPMIPYNDAIEFCGTVLMSIDILI